MKKRYWKQLTILAITIVIFSCESNRQKDNEKHAMQNHGAYDSMKDKPEKSFYYCPMDTQVVQSTSGICPICKMNLVRKTDALDIEEELIYSPVNSVVLSNIRTVKPVFQKLPLAITVPGYISYDTRRIYSISSRIGGRIEKLNVKYTYQPVSIGQPLLEIYSHDLLTAQQEYKYVKNNDTDDELIAAAKSKLLQLGMTESQINKISVSSTINPTTVIYSPYAGYIIEANQENNNRERTAASMSNEKMSIEAETKSRPGALLREGSYVKKGESLFKVANTDIVWGIFETFSSNLKALKPGQSVYITVSNTNEILKGEIGFIEPDFNDKTETVKFRVFLENKNGHLKIGNLLKGEVKIQSNSGLWIPRTSVIDLGKEQVVFVKINQAFKVKKIVTGMVSDEKIEIIDGLHESDEIAENAQFMIDSESFIKTKN